MNNGLYYREDNGAVVTEAERYFTISLIKLLFRLEIIDESQSLNVAMNFRALFV